MPFEPGNELGKKGKVFDGALRRAIAQDDGKRIRQAAEVLLDKAAEGEPWALNMLADRLDGKAAQGVTLSGDPDAPIVSKVVREIVHAKNPDA